MTGVARFAAMTARACDHAQGRRPGRPPFDTLALTGLTLIALTIAVTGFRRTLD
jgi:hypothetical protein